VNSILSWFVSAVIVGILLNLAAAYAKPTIDKLWCRYSQSYLVRSEAKERDFQRQVSDWLENSLATVELRLYVLQWIIISFFCITLAALAVTLFVVLQQQEAGHTATILDLMADILLAALTLALIVLGLYSVSGITSASAVYTEVALRRRQVAPTTPTSEEASQGDTTPEASPHL
jgi:hypothetical protein